MIPFACQFIDAVHIDGPDRVLFIDGQVLRPAVELAGTGENQFYAGVRLAAGFQDIKLGLGIDIQVG